MFWKKFNYAIIFQLGVIPGIIHAFWVVIKADSADAKPRPGA